MCFQGRRKRAQRYMSTTQIGAGERGTAIRALQQFALRNRGATRVTVEGMPAGRGLAQIGTRGHVFWIDRPREPCDVNETWNRPAMAAFRRSRIGQRCATVNAGERGIHAQQRCAVRRSQFPHVALLRQKLRESLPGTMPAQALELLGGTPARPIGDPFERAAAARATQAIAQRPMRLGMRFSHRTDQLEQRRSCETDRFQAVEPHQMAWRTQVDFDRPRIMPLQCQTPQRQATVAAGQSVVQGGRRTDHVPVRRPAAAVRPTDEITGQRAAAGRGTPAACACWSA